MTPESKKLLSQYTCALSNETIYGEGDNARLSRCREYAAKTQAAREALDAHIEKLEASAERAAQQAAPSDYVLMPKRLTAENGAKSEFLGEYKEYIQVACPDCDDCDDDEDCHACENMGTVLQAVTIEWDTIKRIYAHAVELLAAPATAGMVGQDAKDAAPPFQLDPHVTYVCAERDIECGGRAANWCEKCPKRRAALAAQQAQASANMAAKKVEITREGPMFWHTNCPKNRFKSGVMRETKREADRSLIECGHCSKQAYYPVGGVGRVCADEVGQAQASAKGESNG